MEKMVAYRDVELCTQSFGEEGNKALLLIMGSASSMLWWNEAFCRLLADKGFFVIRYDNRDTGRSTSYVLGRPPYSLEDMAEDAIAVLDAYGIEKAVVAGFSLGGVIAQIVGVQYPERVAGLVLFSAMYLGRGAGSLPGMDEEVKAFFSTAALEQPKTDEEIIEYALRQWQTTNKSSRPHDLAYVREVIALDLKRARNYASRVNHSFVMPSGDAVLRVGEITAKTLVVHGTEDVVLPYAHGQMLAKTISGAALCTLEGAGHEVNPQDYEVIVEQIAAMF